MLIKKAIEEILKKTTEVTSPISITGSGWSAYSSSLTPYIRKRSGVVTLTGALKNTTNKTLDVTGENVFTISEGYRPPQQVHALCQFSYGRFYIKIGTDGVVNFQRAASQGTTYPSISSGAWFPFTITYTI